CVSEGAISYDPTVEAWSPRESSTSFTLLDKFAFTTGGICEQTFVSGDTLGFLSNDGVYTRNGVGEFALALAAPGRQRMYAALAGDVGLIGSGESGFSIFNLAAPEAGNRFYALPWSPDYEPMGGPTASITADGTLLARSGEGTPNAIDVFDV